MVLLDTHSLLWLVDGGARFGPRARVAIESDGDVRFSSISIAEIRIKEALGKLRVPADILRRFVRAGLGELPFGAGAADRLTDWPTLVRHDPFDRMLLVQAVDAGATLVTADHVLLDLAEAPVMDARR